MQRLLILLERGIATFVGNKYPITVHIFSQGKENFLFFAEHSIFVYRYHFSPTILIRVRNSAIDISPLLFLMLSPKPFSSAQRVFPRTVQHDLLIYFLLLLGIQNFVGTAVRPTTLILMSRTLLFFYCFQDILSLFFLAFAISTFRFTANVLAIIFFMMPYSDV